MQYSWTGKWLLLIFVLIFPGNTCSETTGKIESGVEELERQLEMGRHEQLVAVKDQPKSVLSVFTTDGCSGGLSVGWEYLAGKVQNFQARHGIKPPWESCCITHDKAYHTGGGPGLNAVQSFMARRQADLALKTCVLETGTKRIPGLSTEYGLSPWEVEALYTSIAALMYRAVRIGGMPCTGLPWRWGYGWPECE